ELRRPSNDNFAHFGIRNPSVHSETARPAQSTRFPSAARLGTVQFALCNGCFPRGPKNGGSNDFGIEPGHCCSRLYWPKESDGGDCCVMHDSETKRPQLFTITHPLHHSTP